jgi:hypothetical protein
MLPKLSQYPIEERRVSHNATAENLYSCPLIEVRFLIGMSELQPETLTVDRAF